MPLDTLYKIIDKTKGDINSYTIELQKDHPIYIGHFPSEPVTPGVVLLQILKDSVENLLQHKLFLKETLNVKFLSLVDPRLNKVIIFNFELEKDHNLFKIKNTTTFLDGTPVMKCNATFVKLLPDLHSGNSDLP